MRYDIEKIKTLQSNLRSTFNTPQGKEVMAFIEQIGHWYPTVADSMDTNDICERDANRRLIGTIKTLLDCPPDYGEKILYGMEFVK